MSGQRAIVLAVLSICTAVIRVEGQGSQAAPHPQTSPAAKAAEIVKTRDGRSVSLNADGTWAYLPDAPAAATDSTSTGSLSLEAGIVYSMGGAQPVAREKFRLLRRKLSDVLIEVESNPELQAARERKPAKGKKDRKDTAETAKPVTEQTAPAQYLFQLAFSTILVTQLRDTTSVGAVKGHVTEVALDDVSAATLTTGFDGKGTFEAVPIGEYFLLGATSLRGNKHGLWYMPVQVKPGTSSLILDQSNFAYSF